MSVPVSLRYRPDIDGLRAVAIILVVLFHCGVSAVSGGFIGVDIFFVISGFLIGGIISKEITAGTFSFYQFYLRRIRRIAPALFFMLMVLLLLGYLLLSPLELSQLAKYSMAVFLSVPNMLLLKSGDYFSADADLNPLLMTWSLGIEEQFYIVLPFILLLWPVVAVYWLSGRAARAASQQWLTRVQAVAHQQQIALPRPLSSYRHFLRFGNSMLDKVASWRGDLQWGRDIDFAPGAETVIRVAEGKGQLILASHLGDIEACRAMAKQVSGLVINALVFTDNAQRFRAVLESIAPQAGVNLLPVSDIGPDTAILLQQKLDAGEWVAIVGDRTAVQRQRGGERRVMWSEFMGQPAPFPQGPFVLAAALRCPVLLMFALRQQGKLRVHCEAFADPLPLPRNGRQQALQAAVDRYAARLQHHALLAPLDWFNFYDFWALPEEEQRDA